MLSIKYIKQLDTLRAIAALLVIFQHWSPESAITRVNFLGAIGVGIFFVLSGFLITNILIDNKNNAEELASSKKTVLKIFYSRRMLRIFPVYYLLIIVALIFHNYGETQIKSAFAYYATFTINYYYFYSGSMDGMLSPIWSLAVEEQFYLIWPWIILLAKREHLPAIISCFILTGMLGSFLIRDVPMNGALTFNNFDAFGLGALLSWQITYNNKTFNQFYKALSYCACLSAILLVIFHTSNQTFYFRRTLISITALWLIAYIIRNKASTRFTFTRFWNNRVLIFLGKISFGLYIYHSCAITLNYILINKYFNPLLPDVLFKKYWAQLFWVENIVLLLSISTLSYVFFEKRFLRLKKYFQYKTVEYADQSTGHNLSPVFRTKPQGVKD